MIYDTFKKRRYVTEYDTAAEIPRSQIDTLLQQAWEVTPSKNNIIPYSVFVIGPEHQEYKNIAYRNCLNQEQAASGVDVGKKYSTRPLPRYSNILNCSYLLIFTLRLEDQPNQYQRKAMARGCKFEATREQTIASGYTAASLEVGMFSDVFGGLCLQQGIDVSATLCFEKQLPNWAELPFITRTPILIMTAGKAKVYQPFNSNNLRPDYNRIVNFID